LELCERSEPLSLEEARLMDFEDVVLVGSVRQTVRSSTLMVDGTRIGNYIRAWKSGEPCSPVPESQSRPYSPVSRSYNPVSRSRSPVSRSRSPPRSPVSRPYSPVPDQPNSPAQFHWPHSRTPSPTVNTNGQWGFERVVSTQPTLANDGGCGAVDGRAKLKKGKKALKPLR
jgi:hypothetical protein